MSWRFRQSFKIMPGVRLNLSKSGVSASIGGVPFTINAGSRGLYGTASIPGTGISFRQRLDEHPPISQHHGAGNLVPTQGKYIEPSALPPLREIRSASTELLTSPGLKELKSVIQTAYEEYEDIRQSLLKAKSESVRAQRRFAAWQNGLLFKHIFKKSFETRKLLSEHTAAVTSELEEQLRLTSIGMDFQLDSEQAKKFFIMRDDFLALADCSSIWTISMERDADKVRERTNADRAVKRDQITISAGSCDLVRWEHKVPHFRNVNGGDLFLYPGFALYRAARMAFSVIECHEIQLISEQVKFSETQGVPQDSIVIGQTWAKVNKDGSRDKRFVDNYQIPIALYGKLTFTTEAGLKEEFQFSNPDRADHFKRSWDSFVASFQNQSCCQIIPAAEASHDIKMRCPRCDQHMVVSSDSAGQEFNCPNCNGTLRVPQ